MATFSKKMEMEDENLARGGTSTIIIKTQSGKGNKEEIEEIELDSSTSTVLEHYIVENRDDKGNTAEGREAGSTETSGNAEKRTERPGQTVVTAEDGNVYILPTDSDEIQFIELDQSSSEDVGNGEVEVVTVDADNILFYNNPLKVEERALTQYNAFLNKLKNVRAPQFKVNSHGLREVKPISSVPKLKNAPALLRSSKRASTLPSKPEESGQAQKSNRETKIKSTSSRGNHTKGIAATSTVSRDNTGNPSHNTRLDDSVQEVYFVYDNVEDHGQNPQLLHSSDTSTFLNSGVLYQIKNGSLVPIQTDCIENSKETKYLTKKTCSKSADDITRTKKAPAPEIKCLETDCSAVAHNVIELRKHLTDEHDMCFDSECVTFTSDTAFQEWREQYERDRMVRFIYRGGTKKISKHQAVTYMICHRSGHYKPTMEDTTKRKRKMKPQGSCKIGGYCTAGIKLMKNLITEEVTMNICHTHYGHPLDSEAIPHLRVSPGLKKIIQKKFEEGMSFPNMLAYIHHNPDGLEGLRTVDRRAVRNIYDTWKNSRQINVGEMEEAEKAELDLHDTLQAENSEVTTESTATNSDETDESSPNDDDAPILEAIHDVGITDQEPLESDFKPPVLIAVESLNQSTQPRNFKRKAEEKVTTLKRKLMTVKESKPNQSPSQCISTQSRITSLKEFPTSSDDREAYHESRKLERLHIQISPELEATIDKLNDHGESGPTILLYKPIGSVNVKYGGFCRAFKEDDFCLIIQTPIQRQILQMFPKVLNFDILDKQSKHDLKLAYVSVLDDYREAIPVAWIIADSMCYRIFNQLFKALRCQCGELFVQYIIAPKNIEIHKAFTANFHCKPKIIQNDVTVRKELRILLNRNIPNDKVRTKAWKLVDEIICEKSIQNVNCLKDQLVNLTKGYPNGPTYLKKMEKDWFSKVEEWSFAFRTDASCNLLFVPENFLKLKKFVSFKGTKKLNQTIDNILKIGYDKCFVRSKRMYKGDQKFSRLLEQLTSCHKSSTKDLKNATISETVQNNERNWEIQCSADAGESNISVYELQSPCSCKLVCELCNVCMHTYICSCEFFKKERVMCSHIHKVHCVRNNIVDSFESDEDCDDANIEAEVNENADIDMDGPTSELNNESEFSILSENQIQEFNLTEVFGGPSGIFQIQEGEEIPKIVTITDPDDRIIYDASTAEGGPIIFQFDG